MPEEKRTPNVGKQPGFVAKILDPKDKTYKPIYTPPDATNTVQGDVLLSDATNSTLDAASGMTAATPKAVKTVADSANNKLDKTTTSAQTVAGPVTFTQTIGGSVSGSAATLTTARNIAVQNGNAAAGSASFNGSANITIKLSQLDASTLSTGTVPADRLPIDAYTKMATYDTVAAARSAWTAAAVGSKPFGRGDILAIKNTNGLYYNYYLVNAALTSSNTNSDTNFNAALKRIGLETVVKGSKETSYRSGAVNITWDNVGSFGATKDSAGYYGITVPSDGNTQYIRTPTTGLLPYSANASNGVGSIGTKDWPFKEVYAKNLHGLADKADFVMCGWDNTFPLYYSYGAGVTNYMFAECTHYSDYIDTNTATATLLISGYDVRNTSNTGTAIVKMAVASQTPSMHVYEIVPATNTSISSGYPRFGYYTSGTSIRFGVILPANCDGVHILPLALKNIDATSLVTVSDMAPSGFKASKLYRLGEDSVYSSVTPIAENTNIWIKP